MKLYLVRPRGGDIMLFKGESERAVLARYLATVHGDGCYVEVAVDPVADLEALMSSLPEACSVVVLSEA